MVEFLLANLPMILCVIAGMALIIVEIFMPGFGVPGISGLALLAISIWMLWAKSGPLAALGLLMSVVAVVAIVLSVSLRSAAHGAVYNSALVLKEQEKREAGFVSNADLSVFVGREGVAQSILRPAGIAVFDGLRLNVVSEGDYIPKGTNVRIEAVEGSRILVKRFDSQAPTQG